MKKLFESKFPFVKDPDNMLSAAELDLKRFYEKTYNGIEDVVCIPCEAEKTNRLRKVRGNEPQAGE